MICSYLCTYFYVQDCTTFTGTVSVQFNQSEYIVTESSTVQIALFLNKSYSDDLIIQVHDAHCITSQG